MRRLRLDGDPFSNGTSQHSHRGYSSGSSERWRQEVAGHLIKALVTACIYEYFSPFVIGGHKVSEAMISRPYPVPQSRSPFVRVATAMITSTTVCSVCTPICRDLHRSSWPPILCSIRLKITANVRPPSSQVRVAVSAQPMDNQRCPALCRRARSTWQWPSHLQCLLAGKEVFTGEVSDRND
jgi:hypothetical protein